LHRAIVPALRKETGGGGWRQNIAIDSSSLRDPSAMPRGNLIHNRHAKVTKFRRMQNSLGEKCRNSMFLKQIIVSLKNKQASKTPYRHLT
jgi:hypothetical protein